MSFQTNHDRIPPIQRARAATYGSLFLLFFVSVVLSVFGPDAAEAAALRLTADSAPLVVGALAVGPRVAGAVIYAALGAVTVGVVALLSDRVQSLWNGLVWDERVIVVVLGGFTLLVGSYFLLGVTGWALVPGDLLATLLAGGGGLAVLGIGYARLRGFAVRLGLPGRDAAPVVGAVLTISGVVAAVPILVLVATGGLSTFWYRSASALGFGPSYSVGWFVESVLFPAVVLGTGSAFLHNGAVQRGLERLVGSAGAIAGATAAFGVLLWSSVATIPSHPLNVTAVVATVAALAVLAAAVAAVGVYEVVAVTELSETVLAVLVGTAIAQVALLIPLIAASVPALTSLVSIVCYTVVAAVAAVSYDRLRTNWVPALVFSTFHVATDLTRHLALSLL